jgi:AI-2 transport protein TqsA
MLLGGSQTKIPEDNLWRDVDMHVREYIVTKTIISLVTAVLCGVVLWMFGVPLAFVLGMLVFLLNFIPNLGPIIANLLPVPLVWVLIEATWAYDALPEEARRNMVDPDMSVFKGVLVIVLVGIIQFVSGNVFETKIMGDQFRLHPIAILLSLMFWYMIWGMVGAFLAVPITSALKIVFAELENTKPVADLLEGNLTILAKRPDQPAAV